MSMVASGQVTLSSVKETGVSGVKKIRYIRDWVAGSSANSSNHWVELKVMAGTINRASGIVPTSVNTLSNAAIVTNNNINVNQYATGENNYTSQYIQIDLGAVYEDIEYIHVWHYYNDGRTYYGTKVEISEDGVTWEAVFDSADSGTYKETAKGNLILISANAVSSLKEDITANTTQIGVVDGKVTTIDGKVAAVETTANNTKNTVDGWKDVNGKIDGVNIADATVTLKQFLLADLNNLVENPDFERDAVGSVPKGFYTTTAGDASIVDSSTWTGSQSNGSSRALELAARNGTTSNVWVNSIIPVKAGQEFFIEADGRYLNTAGSGYGRMGFRIWDAKRVATGTYTIPLTWDTVKTTTSLNYQRKSASYKAVSDGYLQFWIQFTNNLETTNRFYVDNIVVRMKNNTELIVDGAIKAAKIDINDLYANTAFINKLQTTNFTAVTITGGTITGTKFLSKSVTNPVTDYLTIEYDGITADAETIDYKSHAEMASGQLSGYRINKSSGGTGEYWIDGTQVNFRYYEGSIMDVMSTLASDNLSFTDSLAGKYGSLGLSSGKLNMYATNGIQMNSPLYLSSIYGTYNNTGMLVDHGNGNVTISAQTGYLALGYYNTLYVTSNEEFWARKGIKITGNNGDVNNVLTFPNVTSISFDSTGNIRTPASLATNANAYFGIFGADGNAVARFFNGSANRIDLTKNLYLSSGYLNVGDMLNLYAGSLTPIKIDAVTNAGIAFGRSKVKMYKDSALVEIITSDTTPAYAEIKALKFTTASNRDLKKDIADFNGDALGEILSTPIRKYHFKEDNEFDPLQVGIILQEAPLDVIDIRGMGVDIYGMTAYSWKAIQQLNTKIEELKLEIESLKGGNVDG